MGSSIEIPAARTDSGCAAISDAREHTISACAAEQQQLSRLLRLDVLGELAQPGPQRLPRPRRVLAGDARAQPHGEAEVRARGLEQRVAGVALLDRRVRRVERAGLDLERRQRDLGVVELARHVR